MSRRLPLILLPGMMCDARLFGPQTDALADRHVEVLPIITADTTEKLADAVLADAPPRREPQIQRARAGHLRAVMRDEMKPKYLAVGPGRDAILDLCMDMAERLGAEVFIRQSRALQTRPDHQDMLRGVTAPTLILCGREDAVCPLHRHALMQDLIPGSTLTVIENAGHLPTLEQPDATTPALRNWLTQVDMT